jgi:hypothetical protein
MTSMFCALNASFIPRLQTRKPVFSLTTFNPSRTSNVSAANTAQPTSTLQTPTAHEPTQPDTLAHLHHTVRIPQTHPHHHQNNSPYRSLTKAYVSLISFPSLSPLILASPTLFFSNRAEREKLRPERVKRANNTALSAGTEQKPVVKPAVERIISPGAGHPKKKRSDDCVVGRRLQSRAERGAYLLLLAKRVWGQQALADGGWRGGDASQECKPRVSGQRERVLRGVKIGGCRWLQALGDVVSFDRDRL